jgi:hypothetical protein
MGQPAFFLIHLQGNYGFSFHRKPVFFQKGFGFLAAISDKAKAL